MSKTNQDLFDSWCHQAANHIRFGPDAAKVEKELRNHLEDHRDALMISGVAEDVAIQQAVRAMGDPDEVGQAMSKLYSPLIGWLWVLSVAVLVPLFCMCCFPQCLRSFMPSNTG